MYHIDSKVDQPSSAYLESKIKIAVQDRGIRLSDNIFPLRNGLRDKVKTNLDYINLKYGIDNPNSTRQLQDWMSNNFSDEALELCTTPDGKISTKADFFIDVAHSEYFDAEKDFALEILGYRKNKKKLESVETLLEKCDRYGIVKPEVSMGATGRINYKNPALMNIPKDILWQVLTAYEDGNVLISVDIKNQEPWIMINWLGIPELKEVIKTDPNGLYNAIYRIIYGDEPNEIQRKECKTAWNALTYGATRNGLKRICKNIDKDKIFAFFSHIDEMKKYQGRCWANATNKVHRAKTYFGTELMLDGKTKGALQRQHMDFPIQGTGSDILSLLVQHFDDEIIKRRLDKYIYLYFSRHDEIIFEVDGHFYKEKGEDAVIDIIRDIIEHKIDDWEPFRVEISVVSASNAQKAAEDDESE